MAFDDSGDDIEFDEELPADTAIVDSPELNSEENEQPEMNDNMDSSIEDMPMDSMMDDGMYDEVDEDDEVELDIVGFMLLDDAGVLLHPARIVVVKKVAAKILKNFLFIIFLLVLI